MKMRRNIDLRSYYRRTRLAMFSLAVVVAPFFYGFRLVRVQGHSMEPTFYTGQWLLVRRLNWPSPPLRVGDVVVFRLENELLVKRVAALGGQPVPGESQPRLLRALHARPGNGEPPVLSAAPEAIPAGRIYVLGDNPPVSDDSRSFGPIPLSTVIGRVLRWRDPGPPSQ